MMLRPFVNILNLNQMRYGPALNVQQQMVERIKKSRKSVLGRNVLLLVEHKPVYTIGIRTQDYPPSEEKRLKELGAEFYRTDRGGLITFHGPGQLVAYPILNLKKFDNLSVKCYVQNLEQVIINLCNSYDLSAHRSPHTGVWIGDEKVCAIGIHVGQHITSHGIALNCNIDLDWYRHIVPCGIRDKGVTSLSKLVKSEVTVDDAIPSFLNCFREVFNCGCSQVEDFNPHVHLPS